MNQTVNMFNVLSQDEAHLERDEALEEGEIADEVESQATTEVIDAAEHPIIDNSDYPALGTIQTTAPESPKQQESKHGKVKGKRFLVASSRIDELRSQSRGTRAGWIARPADAERSEALSKLQNKEEMAKALVCTKACQFVVFDEESKEWGVCYREQCSFAHSEAELKLPQCAFAEKCNRRHGTRNFKTGKVDKSNVCQFAHPGETADEFYTRTKRDKPQLPATSEKTRQPKPRKVTKPEPEDAQMAAAAAKAVGLVPTQVQRANAWTKKMFAVALDDQDQDVASQTSDTPTVIRVPASMAKDAMKMALARGLTNFQIITE
jgi:hypothetical protein